MTITMYDSVSVSQIPANADAVAGYVGGKWATWGEVVKRFPHAHKLSIAVNATEEAECLDVEPGDATNNQIVSWVKHQHSRGIKRPVIYTSVANAQSVLVACSQAGIKRQDIRLWTAHYTGTAHLCDSRCWVGFLSTADGTQYYNHALNRNLDVSVLRDDFFGGVLPRPNVRRAKWRDHLRQTTRAIVALQAKSALLKRLLKRK